MCVCVCARNETTVRQCASSLSSLMMQHTLPPRRTFGPTTHLASLLFVPGTLVAADLRRPPYLVAVFSASLCVVVAAVQVAYMYMRLLYSHLR